MDINEIRRENVLLLIEKEFNKKKNKFAEAIGKQPSYVSRWFSSGKQRRNIETETARMIELKLKLQPGWMDKLQDVVIGLSRTDFLKNQLIDLYERLSTDGKVQLVQYANDLVNDETDHAVSNGNPFGKETLKKESPLKT